MKARTPVIVMLMLVLMMGLLAAADGPAAVAAGETLTARSAGSITLASHGTAWVPERRGKFALWRQYGWGTEARVKAGGVGDQWVHIPVPGAPVVDGYLTGLYSLTFCARSSNGAQSKPIRIDLWYGSTRFYSAPVNWWADNAEHCWKVDFNPGKSTVAVGVSVLLHFANTTDQITLSSAYASFTYG